MNTYQVVISILISKVQREGICSCCVGLNLAIITSSLSVFLFELPRSLTYIATRTGFHCSVVAKPFAVSAVKFELVGFTAVKDIFNRHWHCFVRSELKWNRIYFNAGAIK